MVGTFNDKGEQVLSYSSYSREPCKKISKEPNDDHLPKDIVYWASRCEMNSLPLFDAEVVRRPDIQCSKGNKDRHGNKKIDFGSHCFQASLVPSEVSTFDGYAPSAVQSVWQPMEDSLSPGYDG